MGYDSWLQSGAYDNEDEEIYIEERVSELLNEGEDCDPASISNIAEAISEADSHDQETIRDYIEKRDWEKLGLKMWAITFNYMEKRAESIAQREVENGALHD